MSKIVNRSRANAEGPTARCALCGQPLPRPDQVRILGADPVVMTVCADTDACTTRYAAAHAHPAP